MEEDKSIKIKKILRNIFKYIGYSIVLILLIIAAFLIFFIVSNKIYKNSDKYPPFSIYTVISPSMEPNINVHDIIFIKNVDVSKLREDDIITFYSTNSFFGKTPITHRIVEVINDGDDYLFRVKGDANDIADEELVLPENIIGRVILVIPKLGNLQFFLASKKGIIVAVMIPIVGIILYDIYKVIKGLLLKKRMKEIEELENK